MNYLIMTMMCLSFIVNSNEVGLKKDYIKLEFELIEGDIKKIFNTAVCSGCDIIYVEGNMIPFIKEIKQFNNSTIESSVENRFIGININGIAVFNESIGSLNLNFKNIFIKSVVQINEKMGGYPLTGSMAFIGEISFVYNKKYVLTTSIENNITNSLSVTVSHL